MRNESGTLEQLWHQLEELAREQLGRLPHVVGVYEKIHELATKRQRIEEEIMRANARPVGRKGEKERSGTSRQAAAKLDELEREISRLQTEWKAFTEQNALIKKTVEKILRRVPPGAPEADQLSRLAIVRGGALTFEEIEDDIAVLLELAARRRRIGESVDTSGVAVNFADSSRVKGASAQRDTSGLAGRTEGTSQGRGISDSFGEAKDGPSHAPAKETLRHRGRPRKFTWEQKVEWLRKRDKEGVPLHKLAKEIYPGEPFTAELRHRVESLLSRTRKEHARRDRED